MINKEDLIEKIFIFGIFGKKASLLTESEYSCVKNEDFIEIIEENDVINFKKEIKHIIENNKEFSTSFYLHKFKKADYNDKNSLIKMNILYWKKYAVGDFSFKMFETFLFLDKIVKYKEFIDISEVKKEIEKDFKIKPKRLFYIINSLKKHNIIEIMKEKSIFYIKYCLNNSTDSRKNKNIFKDKPQKNNNLHLYNNISFIEAIYDFIDNNKGGVTTKMFVNYFGGSNKMALKLLNSVIKSNKDKYLFVDEVDYKSTIYRYFNKANYEIFEQNKIKRLKGDKSKENIENMSQKDRQRVLLILAEKYKAFILDKNTIQEISENAGYKYSLDRKSLIKAAKKAKLKVINHFDNENFNQQRKIICLPEIDENDNKINILLKNININFKEIVFNFFVSSNNYVIHDNLYPVNKENTYISFFNFLIKNKAEKIYFNYDFIKNMKISEFLLFNKIKRRNFREISAIYLKENDYFIKNNDNEKNYDLFKENENIDYVINNTYKNNKKLNYNVSHITSDYIYYYYKYYNLNKLLEIFNDLKIYQIKEILDYNILKSINNGLIPLNYKNILDKLNELKLIKYEYIDNYFIINLLENNNKKYYKENYMNYNYRYCFYKKVENISKSDFFAKCNKIIENEYQGDEKKFLLNKLKEFNSKKLKSDKNYNNKINSVNSENFENIINKNLYKFIKFLLLKFNNLEYKNVFNSLKNNLNSQILIILKNLKTRKIINSSNLFEKVELTVKFKEKFLIKNELNEKINDLIKNFQGNTLESLIKHFNYEEKIYYSFYFSKIKNFIIKSVSVDLDHLYEGLNYLEKFEIIQFFDNFKDFFEKTEFEGFFIFTMKNESKN